MGACKQEKDHTEIPTCDAGPDISHLASAESCYKILCDYQQIYSDVSHLHGLNIVIFYLL